jgi:cell division protein FtsQ
MKRLKKIGLIMTWCLLAASVLVLLFYIDRYKKNQLCKELVITVENSADNHFIDSIAVMDCIQGYQLTGEKLSDIDAGKVEALLENNPHIKNAEVFKEMNGSLHIRVWQKKALCRVVNNSGESYYVDEDNYKMPLSNNYTARVMVCNGNIDEQYTKCDTASSFALKACCSIAHYVHNSGFWQSMIEQIFVTADNTVMLIPKIGETTIIFGDAGDLEDKFDRLYTFYRKALPKAGWDKYKSIDVSYRDQVVARK